ncbi:hypothetical protein B9Z55_008102 [Caenorhabditis nigoni]|uniref:Uncharacterized protein n=1 Tax=Caenorhabditis nigoni TaxID=1611254 RepID=A0A2G5VCL8_9PELO|nr:hypothetical protein B9Z55_008102 [Caenorhabditis nigoni]
MLKFNMLIIWQFAVLLFIINPIKCQRVFIKDSDEDSSTVTSATMETTPETSTVTPETSTMPTTVLPTTFTATIETTKATVTVPKTATKMPRGTPQKPQKTPEDVTSPKPEDVECGGDHICFDDQPIGESDGKNYWNFIFVHFLGFLVVNWVG